MSALPASIPNKLVREGQTLLHQQCWLWGRDVCRPEGNLLLAHGFARQRPPAGQATSSQYTLRLGNRVVRLWGFGLYFGEGVGKGRAGIYINRYRFLPILVEASAEFCQAAQALLHLGKPQDTKLLEEALLWIASYEEQVLRTEGPAYRAHCLAQWSRRGIAPSELPERWRALAGALRCRRAPFLVPPTYPASPVSGTAGQAAPGESRGAFGLYTNPARAEALKERSQAGPHLFR